MSRQGYVYFSCLTRLAGANRGIGLQFIKTFKKQGWSTIGSIRSDTRSDASFVEVRARRIYSPQHWADAYQLATTGSRVVEIDYKDEDTIKNAAKQLEGVKLDVLINCAGTSIFTYIATTTDDVAGIAVFAPAWHNYGKDDLMAHFEVMTVVNSSFTIKHYHSLTRTKGPLLATKHFLPHLLLNGGGTILNISSSLGSISSKTMYLLNNALHLTHL